MVSGKPATSKVLVGTSVVPYLHPTDGPCAHLPRCAHAQNNKDYFDQSLDEIKLLKYVNSMDPNDEYAVVRLYDFFYYKVRLYGWCGWDWARCASERAQQMGST